MSNNLSFRLVKWVNPSCVDCGVICEDDHWRWCKMASMIVLQSSLSITRTSLQFKQHMHLFPPYSYDLPLKGISMSDKPTANELSTLIAQNIWFNQAIMYQKLRPFACVAPMMTGLGLGRHRKCRWPVVKSTKASIILENFIFLP